MGKHRKTSASRVSKEDMMAGNRGIENAFGWIADEQVVHETAPYGDNHRSVTDALSEQKRRDHLVKDYGGDLKRTANSAKRDDADNLHQAYDGLSVVSSKRLGCLEDMSQIAGLEDLFGTLSVAFAQRATDLVVNETRAKPEIPEKNAEGVARGAQNCILAVRQNWKWISKLVKCADIHLQHVSEYHQFFHEVKEYEQWMAIELRKAQEKVAFREQAKGDKQEADLLLMELKEVLTTFLHWQHKVNKLFETSKKIIPIHLRTTPIGYFRPVSSLCDYNTKEINVREGEELTLMDNGKPQTWIVRNMHNTEANVPSVILLIPGPDPDAVEAANKIRLQLLTIWTVNVKRIGKTLIYFMLLIIKDWQDLEAKKLSAATGPQKQDLHQALASIKSVLGPYWTGYKGYNLLEERVENTNRALAKTGNSRDRDDRSTGVLVLQLKVVEDLLKAFKDMWSNWETYRIINETSGHADYMLILQKWQQLKFVEASTLRDLWHKGLDFTSEDESEWEKMLQALLEGQGSYGSGGHTTKTSYEQLQASEHDMMDGGFDDMMSQEIITKTEATTVNAQHVGSNGMGVALDSSLTTLERSKETAVSDQISHMEQEEKKTFVITGVIDPRSGEEVSMQQAVMLSIINSQNGTYNNPDTGESMPIPSAMNAGKIKVEFTKTRKSTEKRRDVGLITITTERESRPYTVQAVIDAKTEEQMSVDDAVAKGILDQDNGMYTNRVNNTQMSLSDALDSGLLIVEFDQEVEVAEPEIVTKTYAIHTVVDQRKKEKVNFTTAVRQGLLDKETGAYYHNVNREHIYVGEAIRRGFIKATIVQDPSSLDIDPENKMVIEKVQNIKRKLAPLLAMASLRKSAGNGVNGN